MERLCNMMMLYDAKEFLPSAEFQWAADILARDVMKEVHAQVSYWHLTEGLIGGISYLLCSIPVS